MTLTLYFDNGHREFTNVAAFYPHSAEENTYMIVNDKGVFKHKFVTGFHIREAE